MGKINHKWLKDIQDKHLPTNELIEKAVNDELRGKAPLHLPPPPNWQNTDGVQVKAPGDWEFFSYVDDRWCYKGIAEVGGTDMCREAKIKFENLKKAYGNPPRDLIYRFRPKDLKKFKKAIDEKNNKKIL